MRIVLVEDQLMFRELLRDLCTREFGHTVVADTGSGSGAMQIVAEHKPDLVILDIILGDGVDGLTLAERIAEEQPATRVLALSGHLDAVTLYRVGRIRLHGFVDKAGNTLAALREALAAISEGRTYFSETFQAARLARQSDPNWFARILSDAELRVLALIARGWSDDEIGRELGLAPATARTHRGSILKKLNIAGTPKLVAFAIQCGFGHPGHGSDSTEPFSRS